MFKNNKDKQEIKQSQSRVKAVLNDEKKLIKESNLRTKKLKEELQKLEKNIKIKNNNLENIEKTIKKRSKVIPKKDLDFVWKIATGLFGFSTVGMLGSLFVKGVAMTWIAATFTFMMLFLVVFGLLMFLGKKTHALLEFKAFMTGKPISLFFTDHKSVEWKVVEPEGGILTDKKYGAFLINSNGSYVDSKTKNVFLAFNPAIGSNASLEAFKITDTLQNVIKDEKQLGAIRHVLMNGEMDGEDVVCEINGQSQRLKGFDRLKENVNFSHLKSLMNTLIPHAINSKVEMTVQQRMGGAKNINVAQIVLMVIGIIGAATFAIMLLNMYGGGSGTTTVVKEVAVPVVQNASQVVVG